MKLPVLWFPCTHSLPALIGSWVADLCSCDNLPEGDCKCLIETCIVKSSEMPPIILGTGEKHRCEKLSQIPWVQCLLAALVDSLLLYKFKTYIYGEGFVPSSATRRSGASSALGLVRKRRALGPPALLPRQPGVLPWGRARAQAPKVSVQWLILHPLKERFGNPRGMSANSVFLYVCKILSFSPLPVVK